MAQTWMVTGGAGFIGSNFVRFALASRPELRVVNFDALTYAGNPANLAGLEDEPRYSFVKGDVRDADAVRASMVGVDVVVHMAAESHVDRSIVDAQPFVTTNVVGTQVMLDAARAAGVRRFVHVSTDEVYGQLPLDRPDLKFTETTPLAPSSPYAASKAASDLLALAAAHTFGQDVVVTRCSNNFGPRQFPEKVIPLFVTNLIEGRRVPLYGDGLNVRDWLHVEDHCEAICSVVDRGRAGEAYNIGGNNERANIDLTHEILRVMGAGDEMIERVQDRPGHDRRYAIDATKIERECGWSPSRSAWPGALEQTVAWYRENEAWWRDVKSGAYRGA